MSANIVLSSVKNPQIPQMDCFLYFAEIPLLFLCFLVFLFAFSLSCFSFAVLIRRAFKDEGFQKIHVEAKVEHGNMNPP